MDGVGLATLLPLIGRLGRSGPARPAARPPARLLASEALDLQDELERVIAEPPPPWLRGPHYLLALLLLALIAVAGVTRTDIVVVASGRLAADGPPLVVQPIERAVVREIRVRPGDAVRAGDVLAVLDPTFAQADRATLAAQRRQALAEQARLEAELGGHTLLPGSSAQPEELLQATLYAQRQAQYAARLRGLEEEIASQEAALRGAEEATALTAGQFGVAREIETLRSRLLEGQVGSRLQFLSAQSARLQAEQQHGAALSRTAELRHALERLRAQRDSFRDEWRSQLLDGMVRLRGELSRVEEALAKAARLDELTLLTAPEDGIVLEVARRSVGSVLREAEPLVTLVPAGRPLIADVAIGSADIGYVRTGDRVAMKVDAFPYQRHGLLEGRLRAIAQDSVSPGAGEASSLPVGAALHRGQVELAVATLPNLPPGARLIPGMTLAAEIKVGSRSVLSFFLDPLRRGLQEALREP